MTTSLQDLPSDAPSRLREALQLPLANRAIADWLFGRYQAPFHRDAPPLAPGSFNDSLIVCVSQRIGHDAATPIHVLLLPTAVIDGIAVGYLLTAGDLSDGRLHPFRGCTRETAGRFAFDPLKRHVVGVRHGVTEEASAVYSVCWFRGNRRQRCYISVPHEEYSFERPPRRVLAMTVKNEVKTGSLAADRKATEVEDRGIGTWSGDVESVHPNVLYDYDVPGRREVEEARRGFEFRRLGSERWSGRLDRGSIGRWLRELEGCLEGRFYSPGVMTGVEGSDGVVRFREEEEMRSCVFVEDPALHEKLRERAAQEYYAVVLPV